MSRNSADAIALSKKKRAKNIKANCLQDMLLELMDERKVSPKDIVTATGISWAVFDGWEKGTTRVQMLDGNILALSRFFNVSLHYLAYGIGDDSPVFNTESDEAA